MSNRSLTAKVVSGLLAASLLAGCQFTSDAHKTAKKEGYDRWNTMRVSIMCQLAEQQYETEDYDKCRLTLKDALEMNAPYPPIYLLAAKVDIEKGELEAASAHLKEAMRLDATSPEPFYLLGVVYQRWQNAAVARDYYQQAWDRRPSEARYMLATVEMKMTLGELDEAQKILEDKLMYFEQSGAVRVALGRIASLHDDHVKAAKYYRDAVLLAPDETSLKRAYAEELLFAKKYGDAVAVLEELRKTGEPEQRVNTLVMLGNAYMQIHRPIDARACMQEATLLNPNQTTAFAILAQACIETNDYGIAAAAARKVLKLEPTNVKAHLLLGLSQQKMRRWTDATDTFRKAEAIEPANVTVLCMLGMSLQQIGQFSEATLTLNKAISIDPENAWAHELLSAKSKDATKAS